MMHLENPESEIQDRWKSAFNEMNAISERRAEAKITKYSNQELFDLAGFSESSFPAGGELLDSAPQADLNFYRYGLDIRGYPVYMETVSEGLQVSFESIFNYYDDRIERIEFNPAVQIPCHLEIVQFKNGRKFSHLSFSISGKGAGRSITDEKRQEYIQQILSDKNSYVSNVEQFEHADDRIIKSLNYTNLPGYGPYEFYRVYSYDESGLAEIRRFSEVGPPVLDYVRPDMEIDHHQLIERLALLISDTIVQRLSAQNISDPIALLELSYRSVDNYNPHLKFVTESQKQQIINEYEPRDIMFALFMSGYDTMLHVPNETYDSLLQQMMQIMNTRKDYDMGTRTLRKVSFLLKSGNLGNRVHVSPDFIVYAIDWEVEGSEIELILQQCGTPTEQIAAWKAKEWIW